MASSQSMNIDTMFRNGQVAMHTSGSPATSSFLQEDMNFEMPRNESPTDMDHMFAVDTQEWVSAQSSFLGSPGSVVMPGDAPFIQDQDALATETWSHIANAQNNLSMWPLSPDMAPSVSEFTHITDTISDSSSPITSASLGEIEGSCSPELIMPPLTMAPSAFESLDSGNTMADIDQWNHELLSLETPKVFPGLSGSASRQAQGSSLEQMSHRHNDSDPQKARSDWRYSIPVQDDGLYHCPFPACYHTPDKLKCNYDKHLDSHLKPYRCKVKSCQETAFSSTACVLRHEREAHGMHGHGNKPFVCVFPECDRSNPENGFPRRWNLHDHMRRMHSYIPKSGSEDIDGRPTGHSRSKRGSRIIPKPRNSKTDTVRASGSRKSSRPTSAAWLDQRAVQQLSSPYKMAYATSGDVAGGILESFYGPWSSPV